MNYQSQAESDIRLLFDVTSQGFLGDGSAAGPHLSAWLDALNGDNTAALRPVREGLQTLGDAINRNDVTGMGQAFIALANATGDAALPLHSYAGLGDKLRELSQKLSAAGGNLLTTAQQRQNATAEAGHGHGHGH